MKATTTVLALTAIAGVQAGSIHKRHGHHKRSDYAAASPDESCKPVVTGSWVEIKRDYVPPAPPAPPAPAAEPAHFTYSPPGPCTVPAPVVTHCATPGIYTFPEQNVHLAAPADEGGHHYDIGSYCQPAATYTVTAPTDITCTFNYTPEPTPQGQGSPGYGSGSPGPGGPGGPGGDQHGDDHGNGGDQHGGQPGGSGSYGGGDQPPSPPKQGGKQWGVTYSPYQNGGGCRSHSDIANDIGQIAAKGFQNVRVYSTDCDTLEVVGPACRQHGIKMIVGAYLKPGSTSNGDADIAHICSWGSAGNWDLVSMVVLGNEAIQGNICDYNTLVGFIQSGSQKLKAAGCKAPVTTAETLNIYEKYPGLCKVLDVAGFNCHPFFNAQNTPDKSGSFLTAELAELEKICGKKGYSLETGWPNNGSPNGAAVPGAQQQAIAFQSIYGADQGNVCYFTWTNDKWKGAGAFNVEQNFGCGNVFKSGGGIGGGY